MPVHRPADERFWEKVDAADCWEWQGARKPTGYGNFCLVRTRTVLPHRYAWESLVGPVPAGMELNHQCRNRACVNPDHLELLTRQQHRQRHMRAHCRRGHPLRDDNLVTRPDGSRRCATCNQRQMARYNAARRARKAA